MITPKQAQQQLIRMGDPKAINRALTNAFRRGLGRVRSDAIRTFRSRGIGRSMFGKKGKGAQGLFKLGKVRRTGNSLSMNITAVGLAAIQEQGGRIAPHVIRAKDKLLAFRVMGRMVFVPVVNHPGAQMPAIPSLAPALERGAPMIAREMEKSISEHVDHALVA